MRRHVSVFLISAALIAACGGSDAADVSPDDSTAATTPADSDPPATDPPATDPPATDPPATDPPATDPPATDPPATDPPATDPPALAELPSIGFGQYPVGVTTIQILDEARDRPLDLDVWFPLGPDAVLTDEGHRYTFVTEDYYESPNAFSADPATISPDGPFPLVVYSHGSGGIRYLHSNYTETLASHGYIVVSADHTGNTAVDTVLGTGADPQLTAINRPLDVVAQIDAMTDPENPVTAGFVGSVDPERIAVTGHSLGGYTTYAAASGFTNELGSVEADPRIDAIIPLAPASNGITDERLASIEIPALIVVGTNDQTTPIDPNVTRPWDLSGSSPHYRLELIDAQHNTFSDLCAYLDFFPTLPSVNELVVETIEAQAVEGCSDGDMAIPRAQELTNTFVLTFLDSVFADGEMITPDGFEIPADVNYLAK